MSESELQDLKVDELRERASQERNDGIPSNFFRLESPHREDA